MEWYQWLTIVALSICFLSCIFHFYRIISLGQAPEYAKRAGHIGKAVRYSFTGAMSPRVKESAYMHMPTYMAGIMYHLGTFLALFLFFLIFLDVQIGIWAIRITMVFLVISGLCGLGVLIKRISKYELRSLSNPDDYISNILVTAFQLITALYLYNPATAEIYYITSAILLLYFPVGKLKHAIYFFAARYHLGIFYGSRGVWPPKPVNK